MEAFCCCREASVIVPPCAATVCFALCAASEAGVIVPPLAVRMLLNLVVCCPMSNWTSCSEAWSSNLSEILRKNCFLQFGISDKLELHASERQVQFDIGQQSTKLKHIRTAHGGTMTPASEEVQKAKHTVAAHGGTMTPASEAAHRAAKANRRCANPQIRLCRCTKRSRSLTRLLRGCRFNCDSFSN